MARTATKRSLRNCNATAPMPAPPQSAASPIRFPPSSPILPVPIGTMDPTAQRNDDGGETGASPVLDQYATETPRVSTSNATTPLAHLTFGESISAAF